MYLGSILLIAAHLMFAKTMITPYIPIFILGVAFALVPAAMWPAVAKIVKESKLGTAYGFMFSVQNIGLWGVPILIGVVLDASNPGYVSELNNSQFAELQKNQVYKEQYRNSSGDLERNATFNVKYIVHKDSCTGEIQWKGIHKVHTDDQGNFRVELDEYDVVDIARFEGVDMEQHEVGIRIQNLENDSTTITEEPFSLDAGEGKYTNTYRIDGKPVAGERFDALITVYNRQNGDKIYQEKQGLATDEQGVYTANLGLGVIQQADYDYFSFEGDNYCAEIVKPLDYTNSMLMLAGLGVLGILFAFLLKRDDKVSGYGLEQPNKTE